jgi:DNA-binding transcriptional MocR family regulator
MKAQMKRSGKGHSPAYQRIQAEIYERIASGQLRPGDPVESERKLARRYNVSLMTARHALSGLANAGVVNRSQGRGTFVASGKSAGAFAPFRGNGGMVYFGACLIAGAQLAYPRLKEVPGNPANLSIESSLKLAQEIYDRFSGEGPQPPHLFNRSSARSRITQADIE